MKKKKVVILGTTGMLGSMVLKKFVGSRKFEVRGVTRKAFDVLKNSEKELAKIIKGSSWVINCIGIIKPYINNDNPREIEIAVLVNSIFPYNLASTAKKSKVKVIQIATDCVFSGRKGNYKENDAHDPLDVYGKTKSLGEVNQDNFFNLRCSIIGPETKNHLSLLDWFVTQPKNAKLKGFTNHKWNGITSYHFAKICMGIIQHQPKLPGIHHLVPADSVSKDRLLRIFAREFDRSDVKIQSVSAPTVINRTLSTNNKRLNNKLWKLAGYDKPPTIERMVNESINNIRNKA